MAHRMTTALKALGTGPALIKLRQKTSQPMDFKSGKETRTTVVEEHISIEGDSWTEIAEDVFQFRGTMDVVVAAEDIFAIFTAPSKFEAP